MQLKNFVSKKVLLVGIAVVGLGAGLALGLGYRSAHGSSAQQDAAIMPQKNVSSNYQHSTNTDTGQNNATTTTTGTKKSSKTNSTALDVECPVKAETNAKGINVFYLPNMRGYAKVSTTTCFKTAELAAAAGYKSASVK